ncbi:hypothetical protein ACOU99_002431 [Enterococcus hirae]
MKYNRCATTVERQVEILKERGLVVENIEFAIKALKKLVILDLKDIACLIMNQKINLKMV